MLVLVPGPVVVAAHGTRSAAGREVVEAVARRVAGLLPGRDVVVGCVDVAVQRPGVADVLRELGPSQDAPASVVPVLLSRGKHARDDLGDAVAEAHVPARVAGPLGPSRLLAAAGARRLAEAGVGVEVPVVLAAAGSVDPRSFVDLTAAARLLEHARGPAGPDRPPAEVAPAFVTAAPPRPPLTRRRLRERAGRDAAMSPYMLAPGFLPDRLVRQAPGGVVAAVLGDAPEVAARVVEVVRALDAQGRAEVAAADGKHPPSA